jgi:hypothetical protein
MIMHPSASCGLGFGPELELEDAAGSHTIVEVLLG